MLRLIVLDPKLETVVVFVITSIVKFISAPFAENDAKTLSFMISHEDKKKTEKKVAKAMEVNFVFMIIFMFKI